MTGTHKLYGDFQKNPNIIIAWAFKEVKPAFGIVLLNCFY